MDPGSDDRFKRTHEHRHRAVLLAPRQRIDGVLACSRVAIRRPNAAGLSLPPNIGHPSVIGFADRHFELGLIGDLLDEDRRIHHLDINSQSHPYGGSAPGRLRGAALPATRPCLGRWPRPALESPWA